MLIYGVPEITPWLLVPLLLWSSVWKAIALWKSGRNNQLIWFVVLFLVNTVGILEIIYIFGFQKGRKKRKRRKK